MKTVTMNKQHYLYVDEEDLEVAADLEARPEVVAAALEAVVEDEEQQQLQDQQQLQGQQIT